MQKHIQYKTTDQDWLDEYIQPSPGAAAKQIVDRYQLIVSEDLKKLKFTEDEAVAIWSALNGSNTSHVEMLEVLKKSVISDLIDGKRIELAERLKTLSFCQWIAVIDACDRVGAGSYQIGDLAKELKRVGLIN